MMTCGGRSGLRKLHGGVAVVVVCCCFFARASCRFGPFGGGASGDYGTVRGDRSWWLLEGREKRRRLVLVRECGLIERDGVKMESRRWRWGKWRLSKFYINFPLSSLLLYVSFSSASPTLSLFFLPENWPCHVGAASVFSIFLHCKHDFSSSLLSALLMIFSSRSLLSLFFSPLCIIFLSSPLHLYFFCYL